MPLWVVFFAAATTAARALIGRRRNNVSLLRSRLESEGFVEIGRVLSRRQCAALIVEYNRLFRGDFDTGVYPDEWHWREGLSLPGAVREIVNAWKCSHVVARVALDSRLAELCCGLGGAWPGARLAQDDCIWKPPNASGVGFHRDAHYISDNFEPRGAANSLTVWIALDDADDETGVVQYAVSDDDDTPGRFFAAAASDTPRETTSVRVPAGCAIVHSQSVLHGSGPNTSASRHRRALVLHFIRDGLKFRKHPPPDYIYGRYVVVTRSGDDDDDTVHDCFFPLVFATDGRHDLPSSQRQRRLAAAAKDHGRRRRPSS